MSSDVVLRIARDLASRHGSLGLSELSAGAIVLDPETLAGLKGRVLDASGARALREELVRWLRSKNQFIAIAGDTEEEIESVILKLSEALSDEDLEDAQDTLDDAVEGLASIVRESLGNAPREVVASEYLPEVQLAVLALKLSDIGSPLLDVGCGSSALLVRHLRALGHDATGIDRDAGSDVTRADWLTYDYGVAKWKMVLSHLGFSLHFLRAHRASDEEARRYAETYVRITRSLVVGGVFAYAPSLPFFEDVLPTNRFRIERFRVRGGETLESLRKTSGLDLAEATHVTRMA